MDANECLGERVSSFLLLQRGNLPALESGQIGSSLVQGQAPSSRATALCPTVSPLKKRPRDDWVASEKAQGSSFSFLFASARSHEGLRLRR